MHVTITKHAIDRYRQRIYSKHSPPCSNEVCKEHLEHAVQIARPASRRQVEWLAARGRGGYGGTYLYCEPESLMMMCRRSEVTEDGLYVVTVSKVPSDAELKAAHNGKRRKRKDAIARHADAPGA